MARVLDDIVHYFKAQGVDILSASCETARELCIDQANEVIEHLSVREHPLGDLICSVVEAEQYIEHLQTEVRTLRADCRALRKGD